VQDLPSGNPRAIADRAYGFSPGSVSPDGLWVIAYGEWTEDAFLLPTSGGPARAIPDTKGLDLIRWSPDGKSLFFAVIGSIPAEIVRVDRDTGRREPWKSLAPPERSGLIEIFPIFLAADARSYAYGFGRAGTSDLYLISGLH
jgi:hypothetical protein